MRPASEHRPDPAGHRARLAGIWPFFIATVVEGEAHANPPDLTSDQGLTLWLEARPAARGQGVGRALGEYAVTSHRENGFRGVSFDAVVESGRDDDCLRLAARASVEA